MKLIIFNCIHSAIKDFLCLFLGMVRKMAYLILSLGLFVDGYLLNDPILMFCGIGTLMLYIAED